MVKITWELLVGGTFEAAARAAGVASSTLYRWMAKARAGDSRFGPINEIVTQAKHVHQLDAALGYFKPKLKVRCLETDPLLAVKGTVKDSPKTDPEKVGAFWESLTVFNG